MPSFDVVSEVNTHEVSNAVDQANREVTTRFDFKGSGASFSGDGDGITMQAESEFQLNQMLGILQTKLNRRGVDIACLEPGKVEISGKTAKQTIVLRQGIDTLLAKQIVKMIKDSKLKVQAAIQGDKVRITGKKRDDLQHCMSLLREAKIDLPLQFNNLRD